MATTTPFTSSTLPQDAAAGITRGGGRAPSAWLQAPALSAREADLLALAIRSRLDGLVLPLARAARVFVARSAWKEFGFARLRDHAHERFGRSGRWVQDLAAVGRGVEALPGLGEALTGRDGGPPLGLVRTQLIAGVAIPESLPAWVSLARTRTVRQLKEMVRGDRTAGSRWPDGPSRSAEPEAVSGAAASRRNRVVDDPDDERIQVRLRVPRPVRLAWDEARDLHRAVEGGRASLPDFVESVYAETLATHAPLEVDEIPLSEAAPRREAGLSLLSSHEGALPPPLPATPGPASLDRPDAHLVNPEARIRELLALQEDLERRLARLLADMEERRAWHRLRFTGAGHYAEERLGLSRSTVASRIFLVRALRRLPVVRDAYDAGHIKLSAALELARFLEEEAAPVDAALQAEWVARARTVTLKRLEDEIRAVRRAPSSPGRPLTDAEWHRSLERHVGLARRRVRDLGISAAGQAWMASVRQDGRSRDLAAGDAAAAPGFHGEVTLGLSLDADLAAGFLGALESSRRRLQREAVQVFSTPQRWLPPGAPPSLLAACVFSTRGEAIPSWVGLLSMLEEFVATWDASCQGRPASREARYRRDGWRCMAPACTSQRSLEDHHIVYRSHQRDDSDGNRVCLCRFHHRQGEHGDLMVVRGRAPLRLRWMLGRRGRGGRYVCERRLDR